MDDKKEKILDKIKKLLALSKSDNVHESARALAQVQKMMKIYNLQEIDIENSYINSHLSKFKVGTQKLPNHINFLASLMKRKFAVEVLVDSKWNVSNKSNIKVDRYFEFFGFNENPEIACYVFDFLARKIQKDRMDFLKTLNKNLKRLTKIKKADAFCYGWIVAINDKLDNFVLNEEQSNKVFNFIKNKTNTDSFGEMKATRKLDLSKSKYTSSISEGLRKGNEVQLNHGVKNREKEIFKIGN